MMTPWIGVLGVGGAVGRTAAEYLGRAGYRLRGGARQTSMVSSQWLDQCVGVDAFDPASLAQFCQGCRVVLNCAGPSYWIVDRVARAAAQAGADYVDVFGGPCLAHALGDSRERVVDPQGTSLETATVIDAGAFPGLSEIAPLWLARSAFARVESMNAWGGGLEACSPAGAADLLLSALDGLGVVQGDRQAGPAGFSSSACAIPFTSEQFLGMAESLECDRAQWAAVFSSAQVADSIARLCASLVECREEGEGTSGVLPGPMRDAVAELVSLAERELAGRQPYYALSVEMSGRGLDGEPTRKRLLLRGDNSYRVSARVATLCSEILFEQRLQGGLYRAWQLVDPFQVLDALMDSGTLHTRQVVDLPLATTVDTRSVDEGVV